MLLFSLTDGIRDKEIMSLNKELEVLKNTIKVQETTMINMGYEINHTRLKNNELEVKYFYVCKRKKVNSYNASSLCPYVLFNYLFADLIIYLTMTMNVLK